MRLGAGPNFDCRSHRRGVPSFALVLRSRRWVLVSEERGALSSCGDRHRLAAEERRVTDEQLRRQLVFLRENEKAARARPAAAPRRCRRRRKTPVYPQAIESTTARPGAGSGRCRYRRRRCIHAPFVVVIVHCGCGCPSFALVSTGLCTRAEALF